MTSPLDHDRAPDGDGRSTGRPKERRRLPALFGFGGRVERSGYMTLQVISALLFVAAIGFVVASVRVHEAVPGVAGPRVELMGWAIGGAVGAMVASVLIGAGAVTRRARDGALPAIFIGLFYVVNRMLLPVNVGQMGSPVEREIALHFAFIMIVVQILLFVRGTVPDTPARAKVERAAEEPDDPRA